MQVMQEPAYILKNGKNVPYIPIEVKTARDAYAASLHVLFKHVADFHICIVQTFSKKYGIPEDDILKTIQESEEFKNMHVDPVLDPETLGYLSCPIQEPAPAPAKKRVVKKKPVESAPEPNEQPDSAPAKKQIVKKTVVKEPAVKEPALKEPAVKEPAVKEPKETQDQDQDQDPNPIVPAPALVPAEKKRVIKKKPVAAMEPSLRTDEEIQVQNSNAGGTDVAKLLAISDATEAAPIQKKIIRKKM